MNSSQILLDSFGRVAGNLDAVLDGLSADDLVWLPDPGSNSIGWLVWHLTRVEDSHIAELLDGEQLYVRDDWGPRFGLTTAPHDTGYGHTPEQVAAVRPDGPAPLLEYFGAVRDRTDAYLAGLTDADLDDVVDRNWDPPVTRGVRLVSIADDEVQHIGQATYVRGLLERHVPLR